MAPHGKDYYLAPAYPMLPAAGDFAVEWRLGGPAARPWGLRLARAAILILVAAGGAVFAPLALPLLSPEAHAAYQQRLGIAPEKTEVAQGLGTRGHMAPMRMVQAVLTATFICAQFPAPSAP